MMLNHPILTYQSRDKSQARLNNDNTVITEILLINLKEIHNIPVECETSDHDTSVQTQDATVGDFSREEVVEVVPLYIWANKTSSKDYTFCIQQNGDQCGYIPLTDLKLYHGPEVRWEETLSFYFTGTQINQAKWGVNFF